MMILDSDSLFGPPCISWLIIFCCSFYSRDWWKI